MVMQNKTTENETRAGWTRSAGAAKYCGVSGRTIREWQTRGLISFAKVSHRVCLFKIADLDKALDRLVTKAVGAK